MARFSLVSSYLGFSLRHLRMEKEDSNQHSWEWKFACTNSKACVYQRRGNSGTSASWLSRQCIAPPASFNRSVLFSYWRASAHFSNTRLGHIETLTMGNTISCLCSNDMMHKISMGHRARREWKSLEADKPLDDMLNEKTEKTFTVLVTGMGVSSSLRRCPLYLILLLQWQLSTAGVP